MKPRFVFRSLIFGTFLGLHITCNYQDDSQRNLPLQLALYTYGVIMRPSVYYDRANQALDEWQIELQTNVTATQRIVETGTIYDPPHWIAVSDEDCAAPGLPADWPDSCPLQGNVIGICEMRYTGNGEIIDSTLAIDTDYQNDTNISDAEKRSVFTHELGHCLGLKHASTDDNVMYFNTNGANQPSPGELAAIQEVYGAEMTAPSAENQDQYFQTVVDGQNTHAIRHFLFPIFTLSQVMNDAAYPRIRPKTRKKLPPEKIFRSRHFFYKYSI